MSELFTWRNITISVLGALFFGGVCRLGIAFSILLAVFFFLLVPGIFQNMKKEKQSYQRFLDVCLYLEQMESAYRKDRKIYQSLQETEMLFKDGPMKEVLKESLYEIEKEDAGAGASGRALKIIENTYGCEQMELLHDFFLRNEAQGGEVDRPIQILEKRRNAWVEATEKCRSEKRSMLFSVLMSLVLLFLVSESMVFFLPEEMDVMTHVLERTAVVTELVLLVFLARRAVKKNAADWLEQNRERSLEEIQKDYDFIETYDAKKEQISSLKWALIPAAITVFAGVLTRSFLCLAIGIPLTALMLNQHRLDYSLRRKRIKKEVERDFPKWLLNIILLLDAQSVQGAVFLSEEGTSNVLKYPVARMIKALRENPTKPDAYFRFLEDYDVPRVHETMKLLYAISSGAGGKIEEQLFQVVEKNNAMTMMSEKIKNDNRVAGMMGYLFLPVLPAGIKMMMDMALVMLTLYTNMGKIF